MGRITSRRRVERVAPDGTRLSRVDTLAVEAPLEVRLGGDVLNVTMRTPGNDVDLVAGWLVAEGLVRDRSDLVSASYCAGLDDEGRQTYNVMEVALVDAAARRADRPGRSTWTNSACGVCGASSLDAVRVASPYDVAADDVTVDAEVLTSLPDRHRECQKVFEQTGGLHAAGLFDAAGELLCAREDVGRHNAVDKIVGWALRQGRLPLRGHVLQVSGRASFELVQKAVVAGIPIMSAVSAPSSLAVELAEDSGLTLAGFVRGSSFNLYSHAGRVRSPAGR